MNSRFHTMVKHYFSGTLGTDLFDLVSVELKAKQ
jgi:hypothetical protein